MMNAGRTSNRGMLGVRIVTLSVRCVLVFWALGLALGCSSSSQANEGAGQDGAAPDGGLSSIVGEAGTAPDAASGGDAPSLETSIPGTPETVCREAVLAYCARRHHCSPLIEAEEADCRAFADLCPAYYFDSSDRTVDEVASCLAKTQQISCTDLSLGYSEPCNKPGMRAIGQPCVYGGQCASGICTGGITHCGQCGQPSATQVDADCNTLRDVPCPAGTFCHPVTKKCRPGSTIVHGGPGATCDLKADPVLGCEGDLYCVVQTGAATGTCRPSGADGQPCSGTDVSPRCAEGLECKQSGATSLCQKEGLCVDTVCDSASYCKREVGSEGCFPAAKLGEPCASSAPDGRQCDSAAVCGRNPDGLTFSCVKVIGGEIGDPCANSDQCRQPFTCTAGMCELFALDQCVPK